MTMLEAYQDYLQRRQRLLDDPDAGSLVDQEKNYVHPFRIFGNVWYVGDRFVCTHLVDTGDGLLLLDSGNCGATAMLVHAIWEAGFHPADIRWVVCSHGHQDHIGGANFLRNLFGAKLYLSEADARMFSEHPERAYIQKSGNAADALFQPDIVIRDGDRLRFGGTEIQFYLVPGHTEGCIACFFDISDGQTVKRAGYFGGFGFNTLEKVYLLEIGDTGFENRGRYLHSLQRMRGQHVDVFLGNHPVNNNLLQKRAYMLRHPDENPFVDDTAWGAYLDDRRDAMLAFMSDPANS